MRVHGIGIFVCARRPARRLLTSFWCFAQASRALLPAGARNLEVVLHNPSNQQMVVWDSDRGVAQLRPVTVAPRVCPFCNQTLPGDDAQWENEWRQRDPENYMSPHYFTLLSAHLQRQNSAAAANASSAASSAHTGHSPLLMPSRPALPPIHQQDDDTITSGSAMVVSTLPAAAAALGASSAEASTPLQLSLLSAPALSTGLSAARDAKQGDTELAGGVVGGGASVKNTGVGINGPSGDGLPSECFNHGYYSKFFQSVRRIGTGAYGSVYECRHVMDGVVLGSYAVKVCAVGENRQWLRRVLREVEILRSLQHPNVVRYMHSWLEPFQSSPFSPVVPSLFILMNLANGGNLHSRLALDLAKVERGVLRDDVILQDMIDLIGTLQHTHTLP